MIVVGILGTSWIVCGITVYAAVTDESFAIEDDYYERAVTWDETMAAKRASAALGWSATMTVSAADPHTNRRWLTVSVVDAAGEPVALDGAQAVAFHHARRGEAREVKLRSTGDGTAAGELGVGADGLWQVRLRAVRAGDVFLDTQDVWSAEGGG
jgi:nitrogen fixation protein FixH